MASSMSVLPFAAARGLLPPESKLWMPVDAKLKSGAPWPVGPFKGRRLVLIDDMVKSLLADLGQLGDDFASQVGEVIAKHFADRFKVSLSRHTVDVVFLKAVCCVVKVVCSAGFPSIDPSPAFVCFPFVVCRVDP
jgi:hypothetical protein